MTEPASSKSIRTTDDEALSTQAQRDRETIQKALSGDFLAGEELAERLKAIPRLLSSLNTRAGVRLGPHEQEDLAQDVLLLVWHKLTDFMGMGSFEAWLYRFCQLEFQNRSRERARRGRRTSGVEEIASAPRTIRDDFGDLETYLCELGPPDEEVVRLKHFQGLSFVELAKQLDMTPSTAKAHYYRGIRWMRRRLARSVEEER